MLLQLVFLDPQGGGLSFLSLVVFGRMIYNITLPIAIKWSGLATKLTVVALGGASTVGHQQDVLQQCQLHGA